MDLEHLRDILELVAESGVSEVEIEEEDLRIVVRKHPPANSSPAPQMAYAYPPPAPGPSPAQAPTPAPDTSSSEETPAAETGKEVRAPIVGTFYAASSPDADPYVKIGDSVNKGDVLCIIEAMKLMNEIEAEFPGTVKSILVDNGTPVEFDQPLFIIDPG